MEPIFENTTTYTAALLRQCTKQYDSFFRRVIKYALCVLLIVIGLLLLPTAQRMVGLLFLVIGVLYLLLFLLLPWRSSRRAQKRNQALYHADPVYRLRFFDDHFVNCNELTGGETTLSYGVLRGLRDGGTFFLLLLPQRMYLPVAKDGFAVGKADDFAAFCREKIGKGGK